jgi:hypothetical protein
MSADCKCLDVPSALLASRAYAPDDSLGNRRLRAWVAEVDNASDGRGIAMAWAIAARQMPYDADGTNLVPVRNPT